MNFKQFLNFKELDEEIYKNLNGLPMDDLKYWEIVLNKCTYFLEKKYKLNYVSQGRNRIVFSSNDRNIVVKVPKNDMGNFDNNYEYNTQLIEKEKRAKCKIIFLEKSMIYLLVMEKLNITTIPDKYKSLAYEFDSMQIGLNKRGKYVGYDYGRW